MRYRNVNTGQVIDVSCKISGKSWEPVGAPAAKRVQEEIQPAKKEKVAPVQQRRKKGTK